MKTIYIFRHGETDWNLQRRFQGSTDIPLNATGRSQALVLKEFFKSNPVEAFFSSDLQRAHQTAEIARGDMSVPIITDSRLRETNLGKAEGLTDDQVELHYGEIWKRWISADHSDWHVAFPGGESKLQHTARLVEGLKDLLTKHPYERVGVASHGGAIRRLIYHMRPDLKDQLMIANCVLYEMRFSDEHGLHILDLTPR
jgi:probable phosphoglycerate mutase